MIIEKIPGYKFFKENGVEKVICTGVAVFDCKCDICGKMFSKSRHEGHTRTDVCSDSCAYVRDKRNQKEKKLQARITKCSVCGRKFVPSRKGAIYCSDKCRQAAYRARKTNISIV
jgi:hypothetical protein